MHSNIKTNNDVWEDASSDKDSPLDFKRVDMKSNHISRISASEITILVRKYHRINLPKPTKDTSHETRSPSIPSFLHSSDISRTGILVPEAQIHDTANHPTHIGIAIRALLKAFMATLLIRHRNMIYPCLLGMYSHHA
jgi:hypothetical protein